MDDYNKKLVKKLNKEHKKRVRKWEEINRNRYKEDKDFEFDERTFISSYRNVI